MNYYIDFDNTLYETSKLTNQMLDAIVTKISRQTNLNEYEIMEYAKSNFNTTLGNIYNFSKDISEKYNIDSKELFEEVDKILSDGKNNVYGDVISFLEKAKEKGNKLFILTYVQTGNQEYQLNKILGSGIAKYFDGIIITTDYKFQMDLNYENGIFIDDDPRDLNGLIEKNAFKIIRMRRPNHKRSSIDIDSKEIIEVESFDEIDIDN